VRTLHLTVAGAIVVLVLLLAPSAVGAQDEPGQAVFGNLVFEDPETGENVPVEGAIVTVIDVGTATSDANGDFRIEVEVAGTYVVEIDLESLPEGVVLRNPERQSLERVVEDGQDGRVLFALTAGESDLGSAADTGTDISFRRVAQLTVEGLKQGLYLAMAAIGLSLIFGTTGLVNFAHAEMVTWGMLVTYMFNFYGLAGFIGFLAPLPAPFGGGVNLIFAGVFGVLTGGLMGFVLDRFVFRPSRQAGVGLIAQMVMTIGLSILLRYLFLYSFGGNPRTFGDFAAQRAWKLGPVEITPKDLAAMTLSAIVLVGVGLYLQRTRMGKAMRAVSDNRDLAESSGIDVQRVIAQVWIAGGGLAALGGVFFGLDQVKWDFGFRILLLIFAAVVLGGLGTAYGALVGSLVVGLVINLSTLVIDVELKNMVALVVLVLVLLVRPQGILGRSERVG
jgi:branched-chain amino acid transport system permease protein